MEIPNQKSVWNSIAPEWFKFKDDPDPDTIKFVKSCNGKILDLGCGTGRHFTKTNAEIYAVDFSKNMIKLAKQKAKKLKIKNIQFSVAEATKLPFENNFFDCVITIAMLHCIQGKQNREKVLSELFRVLKPKAKLRLSVWNKESTRFKNKNKEDTIKWRDKGTRYYYFYNKEELIKEVKSIGFKVLEKKSGISITLVVQKLR